MFRMVNVRAMILTPMTISLDVPNTQYKQAPVKVVYSPNAGDNLANSAYAIACGTTTSPTVMPATCQYTCIFFASLSTYLQRRRPLATAHCIFRAIFCMETAH